MKVGIIIQARMASTRLPGKIAKELPYRSGLTVLEQVVRRASACREIQNIIVATTTAEEDEQTARLALKAGAGVFRGEVYDVLARYYLAARRSGIDIVVRITSDCPCVDPELVDEIIRAHLDSGADYSSNVMRHPYPSGFDVEVMNFGVLREAYLSARKPYDREHVTPYIRHRPDIFKISSFEAPAGLRRSGLRLTLDTFDDYVLLCEVFGHLYEPDRIFGFREVMRLLDASPWLKYINRRSLPKTRITSRRDALRQAITLLNLQELKHPAGILEKHLAGGCFRKNKSAGPYAALEASKPV